MFKYDSDEKILGLVNSFESAAIRREDWGHAEHLVVAAYYCSKHGSSAAYDLMKSGILNLLTRGFGIDTSKESPYHETLTVFWIGAVGHFLDELGDAPLSAASARLTAELGKDFPLDFYDRDTLFSDTARAEFVPPRTPFPWETHPGQ